MGNSKGKTLDYREDLGTLFDLCNSKGVSALEIDGQTGTVKVAFFPPMPAEIRSPAEKREPPAEEAGAAAAAAAPSADTTIAALMAQNGNG